MGFPLVKGRVGFDRLVLLAGVVVIVCLLV
jgi:hypothetical protein